MKQTHIQEIRECTDCGAGFDLARQRYYALKCPACVLPERTWPLCAECAERIPPGQRDTKAVRGTSRDPSRVDLPVHKECPDG